MFKNPFSFEGRIRRLEYGLSYLIFIVYMISIMALLINQELYSFSRPTRSEQLNFFLAMIPAYCFIFAQGAKRCHDRGYNGWRQFIYHVLLLSFAGQIGPNKYGENPKGLDWDTEAMYNNGEEVQPIDDVDEAGVIKS